MRLLGYFLWGEGVWSMGIWGDAWFGDGWGVLEVKGTYEVWYNVHEDDLETCDKEEKRVRPWVQ